MREMKEWDWRQSSAVLSWYQHGATEPWTAAVVRELTRAKLWDGPRNCRVLETGTFKGTTTRELMEAMTGIVGAELYSVEMDDQRRVEALAWLGPWKPRTLTLHLMNGDALSRIREFPDAWFDVAWVDDDHVYDHVFQEIDNLIPRMKPGGIIMMHDVMGVFKLNQVVDYFGGISLDIPRMHAGGGIGLIQVP